MSYQNPLRNTRIHSYIDGWELAKLPAASIDNRRQFIVDNNQVKYIKSNSRLSLPCLSTLKYNRFRLRPKTPSDGGNVISERPSQNIHNGYNSQSTGAHP